MDTDTAAAAPPAASAASVGDITPRQFQQGKPLALAPGAARANPGTRSTAVVLTTPTHNAHPGRPRNRPDPMAGAAGAGAAVGHRRVRSLTSGGGSSKAVLLLPSTPRSPSPKGQPQPSKSRRRVPSAHHDDNASTTGVVGTGQLSPHRSKSHSAAEGAIPIRCRHCTAMLPGQELEVHQRYYCPLMPLRCRNMVGNTGQQCGFVCFGREALVRHERRCKHRGAAGSVVSTGATTPAPGEGPGSVSHQAAQVSTWEAQTRARARSHSPTQVSSRCEYCQYVYANRHDAAHHTTVCPFLPVPCPLLCKLWMERSAVPQHVRTTALLHSVVPRPNLEDYSADDPRFVIAVLTEVLHEQQVQHTQEVARLERQCREATLQAEGAQEQLRQAKLQLQQLCAAAPASTTRATPSQPRTEGSQVPALLGPLRRPSPLGGDSQIQTSPFLSGLMTHSSSYRKQRGASGSRDKSRTPVRTNAANSSAHTTPIISIIPSVLTPNAAEPPASASAAAAAAASNGSSFSPVLTPREGEAGKSTAPPPQGLPRDAAIGSLSLNEAEHSSLLSSSAASLDALPEKPSPLQKEATTGEASNAVASRSPPHALTWVSSPLPQPSHLFRRGGSTAAEEDVNTTSAAAVTNASGSGVGGVGGTEGRGGSMGERLSIDEEGRRPYSVPRRNTSESPNRLLGADHRGMTKRVGSSVPRNRRTPLQWTQSPPSAATTHLVPGEETNAASAKDAAAGAIGKSEEAKASEVEKVTQHSHRPLSPGSLSSVSDTTSVSPSPQSMPTLPPQSMPM